MKKLFVPYELMLGLEEKGFDEECFGIYYNKDGDVRKTTYPEYGDAPLYQQVIDWFREKHSIKICENEFFTNPKQWSVKQQGHFSNEVITLNEAIEEALKLI